MYPAVCFHPYSGRPAALSTVFFSGLFLSEYTKPTPHSSFCLSGAFSILSRYKQLEQITVNISFPLPKPVLSDPIFLSLPYYNIFFFCCHYTYGINLQPLRLLITCHFSEFFLQRLPSRISVVFHCFGKGFIIYPRFCHAFSYDTS